MKAGQLRHRVTIESPTRARDANGQNIPTWTEVDTVAARIKDLSARQIALNQASTNTATATYEITIRFLKSLQQLHRIRFDDNKTGTVVARYFTINDIDDVEERGIEQVIKATEVTL